MRTCMRVCACLWSQRTTSAVTSQVLSTFFFWDRDSSWPGIHQIGQTFWPARSGHLPVFISPTMRTYAQIFMWVLGVKLKSLCLGGAHFTDWASPQSLSIMTKANMICVLWHPAAMQANLYQVQTIALTHQALGLCHVTWWVTCRVRMYQDPPWTLKLYILASAKMLVPLSLCEDSNAYKILRKKNSFQLRGLDSTTRLSYVNMLKTFPHF